MKNIIRLFRILINALSLLVILASCSKDEVKIDKQDKARLTVQFNHIVESSPLVIDTMIYTNASGEHYMITDLQYFISGITLYNANGTAYSIEDDQGLHYTDVRIPSSFMWDIAGEIPEGTYDSVAFTFGMDEQDNISNRFPNPPERDMFWPEILGGGYHHMKLNNKWKNDTMSEALPFMMHLGTGQIYAGEQHNPDSIIGFVPNDFRVSCSFPAFTINAGESVALILNMHINQWYDGPPVKFSLAEMPQGIMQDQDAMQRVCLNGRKVFLVEMKRLK